MRIMDMEFIGPKQQVRVEGAAGSFRLFTDIENGIELGSVVTRYGAEPFYGIATSIVPPGPHFKQPFETANQARLAVERVHAAQKLVVDGLIAVAKTRHPAGKGRGN